MKKTNEITVPDIEPSNGSTQLVLKLYITGASPNSSRAISNLRRICEANVQGGYTLDIIDVYQSRNLAEQEGLIALPMLIRVHPLPRRKLIGDMSDTQKVLAGLGIKP